MPSKGKNSGACACAVSTRDDSCFTQKYHSLEKNYPRLIKGWDKIEQRMGDIECKIHDWLDATGDREFMGLLAIIKPVEISEPGKDCKGLPPAWRG